MEKLLLKNIPAIKPDNEIEIQNEINYVINLIKKLEISEIEPHINSSKEDIICDDDLQSDKYFFLSVLRDIFRKYKDLGDTELSYFRSSCSSCEQNMNKPVHVFEGNKSNSQFGFIPVNNSNNKLSFHFCLSFLNKEGGASTGSGAFIVLIAKKFNEFRIRGMNT